MAVSTNAGARRNVKTIVLMAMRAAGIYSMEQEASGYHWDKHFRHGRQRLDMILDHLQSLQILARATQLTDIAITADAATVTVAGIELVGDGKLIGSGEGAWVMQVGADAFNTLTPHDATGRPTHLWVDQSGQTMSVHLWPIPSDDDTMRVKVHRHLADADGEEVDIDLPSYWDRYLVQQLAADMAFDASMPQMRTAALATAAASLLSSCKNRGGNKGDQRIYPRFQ